MQKNMSTHRHLLGAVVLLAAGILNSAAQTPAVPQRKATRPPVAKRRFTSDAVEKEIVRVTGAVADPELAWMFQACYPNTLDTTVNFSTVDGKPDTFIITGDINAMWLRDSCAQVQAYLPLCKQDAHLAEMIAGLIRRQTACILIDPYANAFLKDASKPSPHARDHTLMKPSVFQRDWELDSLCLLHPFGLSVLENHRRHLRVRRRLVESHAPRRSHDARTTAQGRQRPLPL